MTQLMRIVSVVGFAFLLAFGLAGSANATNGDVSKASYSTSDNPLFQLVKVKPCCYYPHNHAYARATPSTCRKYGGYVVQNQYCGGYGNQGYPGQYPGWGGGGHQGGYAVCCKRKRRDWWSPSAQVCRNQGGYVAHPSHCYNG